MQRQHERAAPASDPRCALSEGELMSVWNEVVREIESFAADVGSLRVNEPLTPESVRRDVESMVDFERAIPLDELTRRVAVLLRQYTTHVTRHTSPTRDTSA